MESAARFSYAYGPPLSFELFRIHDGALVELGSAPIAIDRARFVGRELVVGIAETGATWSTLV